MRHIIDGLLLHIPIESRRFIKERIGNERESYENLQHNDKLLHKIWNFSEYIRKGKKVQIEYLKPNEKEKIKTIEPVSIIFSEYYFYLMAYENNNNYDYPKVYRIDRIKSYKEKNEYFKVPEEKRFKDGEFRKRVQFMYSGELQHIKFEYYGQTVEFILDRLPTAKCKKINEEKYEIEVEVFGKGIIMWLLSQGQKVKVISPEEIRREMRVKIEEMSNLYR